MRHIQLPQIDIIQRLRLLAQSFRCAKRGAIVVEFALILPILLILLLGFAEGVRLVFIYQKIDRASSTVADLVARRETISTVDLIQVFKAAELVVEPFKFDTFGAVIISAVGDTDGSSVNVLWQRSSGGLKTTEPGSVVSSIGSEGGTATLPSGFTLPANDTVIVAESFYRYKPLFVPNKLVSAISKETLIKRKAFFRPRLGSLRTLIIAN